MDALAPFRRWFKIAALACSIASAILTAMFGFAQSEYMFVAGACALFLVACSLASDYINLFVMEAFRARNWGLVGVLGAGAAFVFSLNLISNLGSVGWQRDSTIKQAVIQNTKYDDVRDQVSEGKASLAMWEQRLTDLAWVGTVTADGLRAQLASADEAIRQEERRGGCGPKCLGLMQAKAELERKIAAAEETSTLRRQIEATKAILAKHRAKSETTESKVAAPASQATFFASMATVSLVPTADATTWTDRGIATWLALGLCVAPILFGLVGWSDKRDDIKPTIRHDPPAPPPAHVGEPVRQSHSEPARASPPSGVPSEPLVVHTFEKSDTLRKWSLTDEVQALLGSGQGKLA